MRSVSEQNPAHDPKPKALVLGNPVVASKIAKDLGLHGYDSAIQETHGQGLPLPSDPNAQARLREVLSEFARRAGRAGTRAHVVHPGVSHWAERPDLTLFGQELGLDVITPPTRVISLFANKLNLLMEASRQYIPTLVMSPDLFSSIREIERLLTDEKSTFPIVLKSVRCGQGVGIFVVQSLEDLDRKIPLWLEQLRRRFGEVLLFAERYLEGARQVVIPFSRFRNGDFEIFPFVDASLQSHHRKILEFCPVPGLDPGLEDQLKAWTRELADDCGYVGVGTLEFLLDSNRAYLIDGSARLSTGYTLWEKIAGVSAVERQLETMMQPLSTKTAHASPVGAGVSLRLYAEDSVLQLPQPGYIQEVSAQRKWIFPGADAELSLAYEQGQEVRPTSDGMLGILSVGAKDQRQALTIARGVLEEFWIAGSLQTNERFLAELLTHPWVREGMFHAGFVDEEFIPEVRPSAEVVQTFSSVCSLAAAASTAGGSVESKWVVGDQWSVPDPSALKWEKSGPAFWSLDRGGEKLMGVSGLLELSDGRHSRVCAFPAAANRWQVRIGHWVLGVRRVLVQKKAAQPARRKLTALVSGRVHAAFFQEGAAVSAHETVVIIESLGILVPHALPIDIRDLKWNVKAEDWVRTGQDLASFERADQPIH